MTLKKETLVLIRWHLECRNCDLFDSYLEAMTEQLVDKLSHLFRVVLPNPGPNPNPNPKP